MSEIEVCLRTIHRQPDGGAEVSDGFVRPPRFGERDAKVRLGLDHLRPVRDDVLIQVEGFGRTPAGGERVGQVQPRVVEVRCELERRFELTDGLVRMSLQPEGRPETAVGRRVRGSELDGVLERRRCVIETSCFQEGGADILICDGAHGIG